MFCPQARETARKTLTTLRELQPLTVRLRGLEYMNDDPSEVTERHAMPLTHSYLCQMWTVEHTGAGQMSNRRGILSSMTEERCRL